MATTKTRSKNSSSGVAARCGSCGERAAHRGQEPPSARGPGVRRRFRFCHRFRRILSETSDRHSRIRPSRHRPSYCTVGRMPRTRSHPTTLGGRRPIADPDARRTFRGRVRPRPRRPGAQPQERRRRHPARRAGGVHGRLGLGEVVAGLRHALRRGAAALPRIGVSLRAAAVPSDGRAGGRRDRRPAARGRPAAAARLAEHALLGRERHDAVQPAADAVLARRRLSGRAGASVRRGVLAQHARRAPAPGATGSAASTR